MDQIKDVIHSVIASLSSGRPEIQTKVQRLWATIFEKKTLEHTAVVGLQKGILVVHVDSPAWLFQMNMQKRKVLTQIKHELPDLKEIHFKIGKVK